MDTPGGADPKKGPEGEELAKLVKELPFQLDRFLGLLEEDLRIVGYLEDLDATLCAIYSGPIAEYDHRFSTLEPKEFMQLQAVNNSTCLDMVRRALGLIKQLKRAQVLLRQLK